MAHFNKGKDHSIYSCMQGYVIHIRSIRIIEPIPTKRYSVHFSEAIGNGFSTFFILPLPAKRR